MSNEKDVAKKVAVNIKLLRGNATQKEFAEKLGVSPQAVSEWENAKKIPRMGIIEKLSMMYNVPKSFILGEEQHYAFGVDAKTGNIVPRLDNEEIVSTINDLLDLPDEALCEVRYLIELVKNKYKKD